MYYKLFESYVLSRPPFHNRMVRSNYRLPMDKLIEIIITLISLFKTDTLCYCMDGFEDGIVSQKEYIEMSNEIPDILKCLEQCDESSFCGFFNKNLDFYIRANLEAPFDVSIGQCRCGELEFYSSDAVIDQAYKILLDNYDGFFIVEGSKKHLHELII